MGINRDVLNSLHANNVGSLYRFQGGNSFEHLDIRSSNPFNSANGYVYFSKSMDHHRYFISKRFKQIVNKLLSENYLLVYQSLESFIMIQCLQIIT